MIEITLFIQIDPKEVPIEEIDTTTESKTPYREHEENKTEHRVNRKVGPTKKNPTQVFFKLFSKKEEEKQNRSVKNESGHCLHWRYLTETNLQLRKSKVGALALSCEQSSEFHKTWSKVWKSFQSAVLCLVLCPHQHPLLHPSHLYCHYFRFL